ncbi:6-phosphogluconolactonase [Macrococcus armenti]|uniref:6-phosphogluconolactonase n=1 Tax=Macrococcus armenti TaxID=2875764 RepID=UPI001CCE4CEC|nr:glucosamine-6-phosphate isomerase [Macrococcus armenti]UBH08165.1 glucosamine-6-phosphate isomerase [Macrococcus armenti]UBH10396.1 glucosamine-6-phosphate isomerase [Macrococcus armenti]UBH14926.1 glucosamine-6-phosphate isomerase [Macrococcus armenti]UBH17286.1 glucosamine-6-phosphate isomerase [Macrococcus armenti]UBH19551.1 glucosamine-6-phosphate isomerase [Macrococcus armenti]
MAMNFKVFDDQLKAANYVADLFRKQMNNNPTSIIATALGNEADAVLAELLADVKKTPVDTSQIHIFDYDKKQAEYLNIGIVESQYHKGGKENIMPLIKEKAKTKQNKGKLTTLFATVTGGGSIGYKDLDQGDENGLRAAREVVILITGHDKADIVRNLYRTEAGGRFEAANLKTHRMVNVVLDKDAAQGLPEDMREYFYQMYS